MSLLGTWAALIALSLGIFAITLDGSMMPVAIGSIVDDLDTQVADARNRGQTTISIATSGR